MFPRKPLVRRRKRAVEPTTRTEKFQARGMVMKVSLLRDPAYLERSSNSKRRPHSRQLFVTKNADISPGDLRDLISHIFEEDEVGVK